MSSVVSENVVVVKAVVEKKPVLPAKYARIYQCVYEVLNSCVTEPANGVALSAEVMEGILGVMGFYESSVATQMEFFETCIFEKESLKATKKGMRAHVKQVRQKSGLEPVKEKKARKPRAVKDPAAPKKEPKPRAEKVVKADSDTPKKERKPRAKKVADVVEPEPEVELDVVPESEVEVEPDVVPAEPEPVVEPLVIEIPVESVPPARVTTPLMDGNQKKKVVKSDKKAVKKVKKTTEVMIDTPVDE